MPEPANPPPEDVAGRHRPEPRDPAAGGAAGLTEPVGPVGPAGPSEAEPLLSLVPPDARPAPEPLDVDVARLAAVGSGLWFAGFLVLLPFRSRLDAAGHGVWVWTCLAGGLLGILGWFLASRAQRAARDRRADPA